MQTATSGSSLRLASHVRACHSDGQVLLLDLLRNRYIGVGGPACDALSDHVEGWPKCTERQRAGAPPEAVSALLQDLVSKGLVTDATTESPCLPTLEEATSSLDFERSTIDARISARRLGWFVQSVAVAAWRVRYGSLLSIAAAVTGRRERLQKPGPDSSDALLQGAAVYEKLRPLALTAHDQCLQDSLALVGFLASEGAFPRWVIGVKTRPFGAHSWIQSGGTVLNDQHENVRRFRPILVV